MKVQFRSLVARVSCFVLFSIAAQAGQSEDRPCGTCTEFVGACSMPLGDPSPQGDCRRNCHDFTGECVNSADEWTDAKIIEFTAGPNDTGPDWVDDEDNLLCRTTRVCNPVELQGLTCFPSPDTMECVNHDDPQDNCGFCESDPAIEFDLEKNSKECGTCDDEGPIAQLDVDKGSAYAAASGMLVLVISLCSFANRPSR